MNTIGHITCELIAVTGGILFALHLPEIAHAWASFAIATGWHL